MTSVDIWMYREATWNQIDLTGYSVEALDGSIGKIDQASSDVGLGFVVVDTGPWIFGKKVMLPAGVLRDIDADAQTVFVNRTKEQIRNAPEFDEGARHDTTYRDNLAGYYGAGGAGYRSYDD